jgi:hypothetical protein
LATEKSKVFFVGRWRTSVTIVTSPDDVASSREMAPVPVDP